MPWSEYPPELRQFSGLVSGAAQARYGAAATSQIIAAAAKDAGITLSFQAYTGLARLYSSYVQVRSAGEAIAAAQDTASRTGIDQGVTGAMISTPPYGPALTAVGPSDYLLVKTTYTRETPTGPVTGIFSHVYTAAELHTVGGILADSQALMDNAVGETDLQGAEAQSILSIERVFQ